MGTGSFLGVKWPGHGVDHPSPSSGEVKERVELYLYSHLAFVAFSKKVNFTPTCVCIYTHTHMQGDQKVSMHLMITIQKVTSNVQSVPL
jgi:hypothetical protein